MSNPADPRFRDVEVQYAALKSQLASGQLTREQFETALQKLMVLDAQGHYWMMGAESGRWYVHDGQNWVQQNPPGGAPPAVPPPPPTPDEHRATRTDAATLSSFIPPQAPKPAQQPLPSDQAQTLVGFTPPQMPGQAAKPVSRPDAPTMVGFTPPAVPPATPPTAPPQAASGGRRGLSPVVLMGILFLIVCVLGVAALSWAVYTRFAPEQAPTATAASAATSAPATATSTSAPTTAPAVATPTVARPTATTRAVVPTISIVRPTATTAPATATSAPSNTPTAAPAPTDTPTNPPPPPPTRTPTPVFNLTFSFQGYADWGRPDINNPATYCTNFNNGFKWRQFVWDTFVTNRSTTTLTPSEWTSLAYTDQGSETRVCASNLPNIPAGQTVKATFVVYVEQGRYVQRVVHQLRGASFQRCLDSAWKETPC